jgi:hypothetical protein
MNVLTQIQPGKKVLITTDNWFYAPNGKAYRAVFGTINAIVNSEQALGIRVNARSADWYVEIGDMLIAGCQIHYAIQTDSYNPCPVKDWTTDSASGIREYTRPSTIYDADDMVDYAAEAQES